LLKIFKVPLFEPINAEFSLFEIIKLENYLSASGTSVSIP